MTHTRGDTDPLRGDDLVRPVCPFSWNAGWLRSPTKPQCPSTGN